MKTKKIEKKLVLNKKTIAGLNNGVLKNAHGGWQTYVQENSGCPTACPLCTAVNTNCFSNDPVACQCGN